MRKALSASAVLAVAVMGWAGPAAGRANASSQVSRAYVGGSQFNVCATPGGDGAPGGYSVGSGGCLPIEGTASVSLSIDDDVTAQVFGIYHFIDRFQGDVGGPGQAFCGHVENIPVPAGAAYIRVSVGQDPVAPAVDCLGPATKGNIVATF